MRESVSLDWQGRKAEDPKHKIPAEFFYYIALPYLVQVPPRYLQYHGDGVPYLQGDETSL